MSASEPPGPPKPKKDQGLPGCTQAEVQRNLQQLPPTRKEKMEGLLREVAQGDFFVKRRYTQGVRLLNAMKPRNVKQMDIAVVPDVSESRVSIWKKQYRHNTAEEPPRSGPRAP